MAIDLEKLSPWFSTSPALSSGDPLLTVQNGCGVALVAEDTPANRQAIREILLGRAASDVMMRRGWWPERRDTADKFLPGKRGETKWIAFAPGLGGMVHDIIADDPFTALVEADRWMTEKEKANGRAADGR